MVEEISYKVLINTHKNNCYNFNQFISDLINYKDFFYYNSSNRSVHKKYMVINSILLVVLFNLKFLDLTTTFIGLASGKVVEGNIIVAIFLDNSIMLLILFFLPTLCLLVINIQYFQKKNLFILRFISFGAIILSLFALITIGNNLIVIHLAYST